MEILYLVLTLFFKLDIITVVLSCFVLAAEPQK